MNLTQITAFQAVMTSTSISDAARRLGRTQPAISAAIKALEDQLGLKLFEREGRKLVPVPEAQYLFVEVDAILDRMGRVRETMRSLADGKSGDLKLAAMPGPVSMLFPQYIARQIGPGSDFRVSMFARSSNQIAELARAQNLDFGFADAPRDSKGDNLYSVEYVLGDCFVALPADHRLGAQSQVSLGDLDQEPLGTLQANHGHQKRVRQAFELRNLGLNTMIESQTFLPILQFVASGQCSAILDPLTVVHCQESGAPPGIIFRPLTECIRYKYAIFSPRYRPISVMARKLRDGWKQEVIRLLDSVAANPTVEEPDHSLEDISFE